MKNPMLVFSTALICGSFFGVIMPDGLYLQIVALALFAASIKLILFRKGCDPFALAASLIMLAALLTGLTRSSLIRSENLYALAPLAKETVTVQGEVISYEVYNNSTNIELKVNAVIHNGEEHKISTKINLVIFGGVYDAKLHDVIEAEGVLQLYEPIKFWGDMSERSYYASKGIFAEVYAVPQGCRIVGHNIKHIDILSLTNKVRESIKRTVDKGLTGDEAALLKGILIGDRQDFSRELRDAFRLSGMSHIVAVSGLHVGIFMIFISFGAWSFIANRRWVAALIISTIIIYTAIIGAQPSILRASIMAVFGILVENMKLRRDSHTALMASTAVIALYNPYILHNIGFGLSFFATLGIVLLADKIVRYKVANAGIAAFIFTLPLLAYSFNTITFAALITNILSSPLVILSLGLGYIMCLIPFSWVIISPILFCFMHVMILIAKFFASIKPLTVAVASPSIEALICCVCAVYIIYQIIVRSPIKSKALIASALLLTILIFNVKAAINSQDSAFINFIAIEKGDSIHIRTPDGNNLLVDAGYGPDIAAYLRSKNVQKIDAAILTNTKTTDSDWINYLLNNGVKFSMVYYPSSDDIPIFFDKDGKTPETITYRQGDSFSVDGISFDILEYDEYSRSASKPAVIKMNFQSTSALLMGDIDRKQALEMLKRLPSKEIKTDIIRLASGGADKTTSGELIRTADALFAVSSLGYNQKARPDLETKSNLRKIGTIPLETYLYGTISFELDKNGIKKINKTRIPNTFDR